MFRLCIIKPILALIKYNKLSMFKYILVKEFTSMTGDVINTISNVCDQYLANSKTLCSNPICFASVSFIDKEKLQDKYIVVVISRLLFQLRIVTIYLSSNNVKPLLGT